MLYTCQNQFSCVNAVQEKFYFNAKPMIPPVMFFPNISTIPQIILYFTGLYSVHNKNAVFTKDINLINTKDHFKYRFTLKVLC
ncbi:hypothetical protein T08_3233 [Trichinella sp. T8]|nr:hypothetical protein T08_3233 [Trichinella sp. T8]